MFHLAHQQLYFPMSLLQKRSTKGEEKVELLVHLRLLSCGNRCWRCVFCWGRWDDVSTSLSAPNAREHIFGQHLNSDGDGMA